ncbi:Spore germination protein YndE [Sporomusa ovata DSM 2662]|uniref:Spore germination protein n=1 Tax=Sporomusa ovata TaxID=2378 RepID=A0A0U1L1Q6_9FIRM|nr:GerAB/ArcD/ProY family transporter [Sporomusa ovata]EQB25041.1 spore germination protein A2 [Sporomusa ovata DSM 2662]CQR73591.1 spore germination protein [Sporomusa ovata]
MVQQISPLQLFIFTIISSFGVSMATLPRFVAEIAREDMGLSVFIAGAAFLTTIWIIARLAAYFPDVTCIEYHCILLGPVLGQAVNIFFTVLVVMVLVMSNRSFAVAGNIYLFDRTPLYVIPVGIMLLLMYIGQYGLMPVLRMQQMIFYTSHMVFLFIILLGLLAIDKNNYLPFLAQGIKPVLKAAIPSWYSYTGTEITIGLLFPFITRQNKVLAWSAAGVIVLTVVYTLITFIVQGILGQQETARMLLPTIIAYRSVELPDTFIERIDAYFLIFWIPVFVACMLNWLYFAVFAISHMLRLEDGRPIAALLVPIVIYLIEALPNFQTADKIGEVLQYGFITLDLFIWPLLLWLAWRRKRREKAC